MPLPSRQPKAKPKSDSNIEQLVPPQAIEIEEYVLGSILLEKDAFATVAQIINADSFYLSKHQKIFQAAARLVSASEPIDALTIIEQLKKDGNFEEVGGASTIADLTNKIGTTESLSFYAKILAQKSLARDLIDVSRNITREAYDDGRDIEEVMQNAEGKIFELSQRSQLRKVTQIDSVITEAFKRIKEAAKKEGNISGIPTGFYNLDKITAGWQNSDLIIIAARPAMGKTAFVLSMAKNMAVDFNRPVGLFSLGMSNVQLVNRMIMNVCEIEGDKIRTGNLTEEEWAKLDHNIQKLFGAPIYIDDTPQLSVIELRSKAKQLKAQHNIECIIIDYLQLMNATGMNFNSREQEVSIISRNLKALAKELDIPIIALSQLNRNVEGRNGVEGKRPQLSDLRESGAIEQDADMVCFIHRPEYYKIISDQKGNDLRGIAQFIIAKHRNGATDDVNMRFVQAYAKFMNIEDNATARSMYENEQGARLEPQLGKQGPQWQAMRSKINDRSIDADIDDNPL